MISVSRVIATIRRLIDGKIMQKEHLLNFPLHKTQKVKAFLISFNQTWW